MCNRSGLPYLNRSPGRITQQGLAAAAVVGRQGEAAHDGGGHAIELAHHRLGGRGQLVGPGQDRRLQRPTRGIALAEVALERARARPTPMATFVRPSRHGRPKVSGDDDGDVPPAATETRSRRRARRAIRVSGQQRDGVGVDIGLVDRRRSRTTPAVVRLRHQHAAIQ